MPIKREILSMFELGRKTSQVILGVFLDRKIAKIAKDKCTHRSTNPLYASIFTIARHPSLCGYTPLGIERTHLYDHMKPKVSGRKPSTIGVPTVRYDEF